MELNPHIPIWEAGVPSSALTTALNGYSVNSGKMFNKIVLSTSLELHGMFQSEKTTQIVRMFSY